MSSLNLASFLQMFCLILNLEQGELPISVKHVPPPNDFVFVHPPLRHSRLFAARMAKIFVLDLKIVGKAGNTYKLPRLVS
jgi:hypothetical protein